MRRRRGQPNPTPSTYTPQPLNYASLIETDLDKLKQALTELARMKHTSDGYLKPYLPRIRPPKLYEIGRIKIGLVELEQAYLDDWKKYALVWYLKLHKDNDDIEEYTPYYSSKYVANHICQYLTPRQIHQLITHIRTLQQWVYDRLAGLQRAEQEIQKQQAQAVEVLNAELTMLALKEEDLSL